MGKLTMEPHGLQKDRPVSLFVSETGYVTDAEKYEWSVVQRTVYAYDLIDGANWRTPNGENEAAMAAPVTQVSYNDARAYCAWAGVRLPDYEEYWRLVEDDGRRIVFNADTVSTGPHINTVGNTWDITTSVNEIGEIRIAGGSYLCSQHTCNGTDPNRKLFVSKDTGNSHISFSVIPTRE